MDIELEETQEQKTPRAHVLDNAGNRLAEVKDARLTPKAELPPDASKPDAVESAIKQFILDNGACFYHARGQPCCGIVDQGCCPYSHAPQPVPWGAYARARRKPPSARTKHKVMAFEEEQLTITLEQLQHAKSALDDTSRSIDLPADEPSEVRLERGD